MQRWKTILFNIAFSLNCLLLFLVLFEEQVKVPVWLQVLGRMHPLILHFPIVLLVLTVFWELLPRKRKTEMTAVSAIGDSLLLSAAITAVVTSLIGLFLSREDGYEPTVLLWHKWGGVFISFLSLIWYAFRRQVRQVKGLMVTTAMIGLAGIVMTGHQGANITHGENFLLAPLASSAEQPNLLLEDAVVYTHMVKPVLEAKCIGCHNQQKAKGELLMETEASLLKGGKSGVLWDTTAKDFGLLMRRVHLPLENKKHMPPKGKPQLTEQEIAILYNWVKGGAGFKTKVVDLPSTDTLRVLASSLFSTIDTDTYDFAAADETVIKKLNTPYCVISPLSAGSPALNVEAFSAVKFDPTFLKSLLQIKDQVVALNLSKMPLKDGDLNTIAQFKNLRKLNLSFTPITGATLPVLSALTQLRQLSLAGTTVKWQQVQRLLVLPKLSKLFLWNTAVDRNDLANAAKQYKNISFDCGYKGDTVVLKLNPPLLENEEQVVADPVPLKLKHYVKGVSVRYTTDGSDPDSISSREYNGNFIIDKNMLVKAKAFKEGWLSSDVVERQFYKTGFRPDTIILAKAPDPSYKGDGSTTLMDAQKGDLNFRSGKWLGYKESPLTALVQFEKPVTLSSVTVSSVMDIGAYIMPPHQIEVWGGTNSQNLRLLERINPKQPKKEGPASMQGYALTFKPLAVNVLRVIVSPVSKLPSWHPGRGDRGWIFVDELFFQ
jgi:uncharacterized membrane protein